MLSDDMIKASVFAGCVYEGSFIISASNGGIIKALVYPDREELSFDKDFYVGIKNKVKYKIDASQSSAGEMLSGKIRIVSSCAEVELPYSFKVEKQYLKAEDGTVIRDLYEFAEYAKNDYSAAVRLFAAKEFEQTFLGKDLKQQLLYSTLLAGSNKELALEEFLVALRKKSPVGISVDKKQVSFQVEQEDFKDSVVLTRDNWGYVRYTVRSDSPVLVPDRERITNEDFAGNRFVLDYYVKADQVRNGKSNANIYIENVSTSIKITVNLNRAKKSADLSSNRLKAFMVHFMKNYIDFRTGRMDLDKYVSDSEVIVSNMCILTKSGEGDLLKIHLMIISGRFAKARELLKSFDASIDSMQGKDKNFCQAASLYLHAMIDRDMESVENAAITIRQYYEMDKTDHRLLWFLLYLDKRYDRNPALRFRDIKTAFEYGANSPALYYEACVALNQDHTILKELGSFEINIINWGIRNAIVQPPVLENFVLLALRAKNYNPLIIRSLKSVYEKNARQDVLCAICTQLIKGQKTGKKYFEWYKRGVEEKLKITQLHEYFMYSYDENSREPLPASLLLYFSYNSGLSDMKKAFLYATIIKNRQSNHSTYKNYRKLIYSFGRKQLSMRAINENLKVIYEDMLANEKMDEEIATNLPYVMFRNDICCYNSNFKGLIAVSRMLDKEFYTPFIDGKTQINIFEKEIELFLVDKEDNRYARDNFFTVKKLLDPENYIDKCVAMNPGDYMCTVYMADRGEGLRVSEGADNIDSIKRVLGVEDLRDDFRRRCLYSLIQYSYDKRQTDILDACLNEITFEKMSRRERSYIMEYLIIRGFNEKALFAVRTYGVSVVPVKQLFRLADTVIGTESDNESNKKTILFLCEYAFKHELYNERTLAYLCAGCNTGTKDMLLIFKAAREIGLDTKELEERLLAQILFAESYSMDAAVVFASYYEHGGDKLIIRAFLKYNAYKYLVKDRVIQPLIFDIMKREAVTDKNDLMILALLKYMSTLQVLNKNDLTFADHYINHFTSKGLILPFFKDFAGKLNLPEYIADKFFVEYKADPALNVEINYLIDTNNSQESFINEPMKNVFMGIRVKEFMIFYGERLQYYISEKGLLDDKITESFNVSIDEKMDDDSTRYGKINLCLMSREMKDEKTMLEVMRNMARCDYMADKLFQPL